MSRWHTTEFDFYPEHAFQPRCGRMTLEGGGKGSSAPPPDPRLVQGQLDSMGIQNDAIRQMMKNNADLAPLQKQQMQFGLDSAKTAYDQSQSDRTYALGRRDQLTGLQDKSIARANNFNEDSRADQLISQGMADQNSGYSNAMGQNARDMERMGGTPFGAKMQMAQQAGATGYAANAANTAYKMRMGAKAEGINYEATASNQLAGYPSMGMAATGSGAGFGGLGQGYANNGLSGMNSGYGMASSSAASMGGNAAGMYGAMGNYKNGQDQIAASNDPTSSILGVATGAGMAWGLAPSGMSPNAPTNFSKLIGWGS